MVLPKHGDVANAIGAVVGQVQMQATGTVTSAGAGSFAVHLAAGPQKYTDRDAALALPQGPRRNAGPLRQGPERQGER